MSGDSVHWKGDDAYAVVARSSLDAIGPTIRRLNEQATPGAQCSVALAEAVFTRLACYATQAGSCHPYVASIATALDVGEAAVRRAINVLVEAGIVVKTARLDKGRKVGNAYELRLPPARADARQQSDGSRMEVHSADRASKSTPKVFNKTKGEQDHLEVGAARAPKPAKTAVPNPAWNALAEVVGWNPSNRGDRSRFGKVTRDITASCQTERPDFDWTPDAVAKAIRARASRYRQEWPKTPLTPESLLKHFSAFGPKMHTNGHAPRKRFDQMTPDEFAAIYRTLSDMERVEAEEGYKHSPHNPRRLVSAGD